MNKSVLLLFLEISGRGGIERYCSDLLRAVASRSSWHAVDIVVLHGAMHRAMRDAHLGPNVRWHSPRKQSRFCRLVWYVMILARILAFRRPGAIISGHIDMLKPYWFARWLFRVPYVLVAYGIEVWKPTGLARKILRGAHVLVTISHYTADRVRTELHQDLPIIHIPPLVDARTFRMKEPDGRLRAKYGIGADKIILSVCRLAASERYKGYDKVIAALPKALSRIPKLKYLIVGTGDDAERVVGIIKQYGLESRVVLCGYVTGEELVDLYNLSDVFVLPSKGEGFGIVFLEALACGRPVVAGNACGAPEAVLHGELGLLVDPDNECAIADAIIRILEKKVPHNLTNPKFLARRVLEKFGPDMFNSRVETLLHAMQTACPLAAGNVQSESS